MSIKKANDYFRRQDYSKAIEEYKKINHSDPLFADAQFNIKLAESHLLGKELPKINTIKSPIANAPLVSVVMPVFNVAPYLDASILSVLNQTYQNIELIIVNDASTDNGLNIINMFAKQDSRIKVINLEFNTLGGAGIPSNIGVDAATGKYLAYADSDDILDQFAIEKMVEAAERDDDIDVVVADFNNFQDDTRDVDTAYDKHHWEGIPIDEPFSPQEIAQIVRLSPVPWRKLYKMSYLNEHHIRFPEGDYFYEDNPLHWFVLTSANKIVLIDYVVAYHRMAREGQTMGANNFKLSAQFCHLNSIKNYLLKEHNDNPTFWRELIDFVYRGNWVVDRQDVPELKDLVKKRYAQTGMTIDANANIPRDTIEKMRPAFYQRCNEYNNAYPDLDLAIVIPVYNCVDLLPELVRPLLKLNLKTQIILVDDGSTDGSAEFCNRFADEHEGVYFIQQGNKGAGVARNLVIPLLTAEYAYFVDADDTVDLKSLEEAVLYAREQQSDLTLFKYRIHFFDKDTYRDMWNADQDIWNKLLNAQTNKEKKELAIQLTNYPWNRIIKTTMLHDENIFFGKTVVHNDVPYHWHSIIAAKNISIFDKAVCNHRKFDVREQITNINDYRRLMVLEAYRYTNHLMHRYDDFPLIFKYWEKFITHLLTWAKERIPADQLDFYLARQKEILTELSKGA